MKKKRDLLISFSICNVTVFKVEESGRPAENHRPVKSH
jgi:hypothetical protein